MYIYIDVYIYIYIYVHTYAYVYIHTFIHMYTIMYLRVLENILRAFAFFINLSEDLSFHEPLVKFLKSQLDSHYIQYFVVLLRNYTCVKSKP